MGGSRKRRKAKKPPRAPKTPPAKKAETPESGQLLKLLLENYKAILAFLGGVPPLIYGLGLFSLRSREGLLGLPGFLSYPHQEAVLTGIDVLWRMPWAALSGLISSNRWLLAGAWGSLIALFLAMRITKGRPSRWLRYGLFGLVVLALLFGLRFEIAALFPPHQQDVAAFPGFEVKLSSDPIEQTSFEAVSWLTNETEENAHHRQELNGLVVWLFLVAAAFGWAAYRQKDLPQRGRFFLLGTFVLLALLAGRLAPRGYAVAKWGIAYPTVAVDDGELCDAELAEAIQQGLCCVYDVSAGGEPLTTVLRGACPSELPLLTWEGERKNCTTLVGRPKVIDDDC